MNTRSIISCCTTSWWVDNKNSSRFCGGQCSKGGLFVLEVILHAWVVSWFHTICWLMRWIENFLSLIHKIMPFLVDNRAWIKSQAACLCNNKFKLLLESSFLCLIFELEYALMKLAVLDILMKSHNVLETKDMCS